MGALFLYFPILLWIIIFIVVVIKRGACANYIYYYYYCVSVMLLIYFPLVILLTKFRFIFVHSSISLVKYVAYCKMRGVCLGKFFHRDHTMSERFEFQEKYGSSPLVLVCLTKTKLFGESPYQFLHCNRCDKNNILDIWYSTL